MLEMIRCGIYQFGWTRSTPPIFLRRYRNLSEHLSEYFVWTCESYYIVVGNLVHVTFELADGTNLKVSRTEGQKHKRETPQKD